MSYNSTRDHSDALNLTVATENRSARRLPLPIGAIVLALVAGLPIIWLAIAAIAAGVQSGQGGLGAAMLPTALRETGLLMAWVGLLTGTLGLVAAWLVTNFDFPGRRWFEWGLVLPLAVPTYLAAYTYVEFLGFTGPLQTAVRGLTGAATLNEYWFPDIRSDWGAAFVLSMVLYPYVYVACRTFFLMQSGSITIAARTLGASEWRVFFAVVLPTAQPAIVVGVTLAMLEVVNDLGAVQYFGINSLTAVIYATWINRANFGGAAQLAVTIVIIIALLILLEQWARRDRIHLAHRDARIPPVQVRIGGVGALLATGFCAALLVLGFGIPAGELLQLALRTLSPATLAQTAAAGLTTLTLGALGALLTVIVGLYAAKRAAGTASTSGPIARGAIRLATLGYAIPGTVLALGLLQPMGFFDLTLNRATRAVWGWTPGLILSGSIAALLYVYAIRFLAVSHANLDAAIGRRGQSMLDAGRVLGSSGLSLLLRIDLPTLTPAILSAATLVFVEIVKELPATLLLRPLGVETLATLVYARASVSLFAEAALPALAIVLVGLVPVLLSTRWSNRRR